MVGLGQDEIRVVVVVDTMQARRYRRYHRRFVGMTVDQAIKRLDEGVGSDTREGMLPRHLVTLQPYSVNGKPVEEESDQVLQQGDVLRCRGF